MKIAKKLIIALAVIILLVIVVTFISVKYEENKDKVDEVVALECPFVEDWNSNPVSYAYYMLQSSRGSRESSNYYKDAYLIETDFEVPPIGSDIEKYKSELEYYIDDEFLVIRTNKYIHLFESLYKSLKFIDKQDELPDPKELVDQKMRGSWEELDEYVPNLSFNRETLERTYWTRVETGKAYYEIEPLIKDCKEVDPSIPLNLVWEYIDKAAGGEKKI